VAHYVDSEVSRLATVMLHRPGAELARLTPRNNDSLLFDGIPWVGRAQEEHDAFASAHAGYDGEPVVGPSRPFLDAAAEAMGIDRLRIIDTAPWPSRPGSAWPTNATSRRTRNSGRSSMRVAVEQPKVSSWLTSAERAQHQPMRPTPPNR